MSTSWKATLRLPRSSFPARPNPKAKQEYLRQCTHDFYKWQSVSRSPKNVFKLQDGPPYANGPLHLGHAINKVLKDIVLRCQVQNGYRVAYRPGWDCHGLPIEMKAVGASPDQSMSPIDIRASARRLAERTVVNQTKDFQSLAVAAAWGDKWTTMDHGYEIRQLRVFQKMVANGFIYRKHKPVYWSPSSRTALAEAELEYRDDHLSRAAYVRFPILSDCRSLFETSRLGGPLYAAVWTTTPWTLPANRAIAVDRDLLYSVLRLTDYGLLVATDRVEALREHLPPYEVVIEAIPGAQLCGLEYKNKLRGKECPAQPIVHADFVSSDSGTGLVHLAPGHGQDDYETCGALGIDAFAPIDGRGRFTQDAYPDQPELLTAAPSVLEGGGQAVMDLMGDDILATHDLRHKYPYDWRTRQPVVIRATPQWFADVGSTKNAALAALDKVCFIPASGKARLESFVKGRSEWCISRQRPWGFPIPALFDAEGKAVMTQESIEHIISVMQERSSEAWFRDEADDASWVAPTLQGRYTRGTDTMDVWFDSGSSWTGISGPADVYLEGSDQHRGWFQSSLLTYVASQKADGKADDEVVAPFKTLITHGFALDSKGKKMSKSLGNTVGIDEVMNGTLLPPLKGRGGKSDRHDALGPDALRLWAASSDFTTDILVGPTILQPVHNALIKYRSILKMIIGSLHESSRQEPLTKLDQLALLHLSDTMQKVRGACDRCEFHRAVASINKWVATDLSAFYLEALKDRLYCGDGGGVLESIFVGFLRMLAPFTPLLVEEAWAHRPTWMEETSSLQNPARQLYDEPIIAASRLILRHDRIRRELPALTAVHEAIKAGLEEAREAKVLGSSLQCSVSVKVADGELADILDSYADELAAMYVVSRVEVNRSGRQSNPSWRYSRKIEWPGASDATVDVLPPEQHKCSRCWRYMAEEVDGLCGRCFEVVKTQAGPN